MGRKARGSRGPAGGKERAGTGDCSAQEDVLRELLMGGAEKLKDEWVSVSAGRGDCQVGKVVREVNGQDPGKEGMERSVESGGRRAVR